MYFYTYNLIATVLNIIDLKFLPKLNHKILLDKNLRGLESIFHLGLFEFNNLINVLVLNSINYINSLCLMVVAVYYNWFIGRVE